MNADVVDATPLEGDEKLPDVMGLQLLNVQEPSLAQDAVKDVSLTAVLSPEKDFNLDTSRNCFPAQGR